MAAPQLDANAIVWRALRAQARGMVVRLTEHPGTPPLPAGRIVERLAKDQPLNGTTVAVRLRYEAGGEQVVHLGGVTNVESAA